MKLCTKTFVQPAQTSCIHELKHALRACISSIRGLRPLMIPQVGLRPTGWLNCARFARNSPKKMSPDIYYQPLSCVSLNKKAYLYYLPSFLPPSLPAQPSLHPLPPCLPPSIPSLPSIPNLHPSPSSLTPFPRKVHFPGKSNFPEIIFPGKSIF